MARILAVDDDPGMRAYYMELFTEAGFEVETAADGRAAVERCADIRPDLLVLDADMSNGAGEYVFKTIRRVLQSGKPVVFVTGLPERVQGLALTCQRVSIFRKPVDSAALLAEVRRLLGPTSISAP